MNGQAIAAASAPVERSNRRKRYILDPAFQYRFATALGLVVFFVAIILSCGLYLVLQHQARLRTMQPESSGANVALLMMLSGVAFALLTAGAVALWSVVVTHRLCGPLTVIAQHCEELAAGKFPNLRPLRQKDEFRELYATFARMVGSLRTNRQQQLDCLCEAIRLAGAGGQNRGQAAAEPLNPLISHLRTLRNDAACALDIDVSALGDDPKTPAPRRQFADALAGMH